MMNLEDEISAWPHVSIHHIVLEGRELRFGNAGVGHLHPVNWRPSATQALGIIPRANRAGWKQSSRWGRVLNIAAIYAVLFFRQPKSVVSHL